MAIKMCVCCVFFPYALCVFDWFLLLSIMELNEFFFWLGSVVQQNKAQI